MRGSVRADDVRVVHHVPGRMRVRVHGTRDPAEMLRKVQPLLAGLPAPMAARVNAASGSVVIQYGSVARTAPRSAGSARLLVPLAVGMATRLVLPRRRAAPLWLDLTLLAFDALASARRIRHSPPAS